MERRRKFIATAMAAWLACGGCSGIPKQEPPAANPVTTSGDTNVVVNTPAQPCCKPSIWDFLGVPQAARAGAFVVRRVRSRLGTRFPGLEPKPELLPITDPANLDSPYPSVKTAAEVKAEEDAAAQKIKGINYLASLGCSACHPDIEKALLASLDDCNEGVRYATVVGLRSVAGSPCKTCKAKSCCSPAILKKLDKLAFETDDQGCFVEPSARVRRMARLALRGCGNMLPWEPPAEEIEGPTPTDVEAPPAAPAPAGAPAAAAAPPPAAPSAARSVLVHPAPKAPPPDCGCVAFVNGEPIFYREVAAEAEARLQDASANPALAETAWRSALTDAIDRKLLCQDARRAGFGFDVAQVAYQQELGGAAPGPSADERRLAEQWLQVRLPAEETVAPQEVWQYYRANYQRYQLPGQVRYESIAAPLALFASREEAQKTAAFLRDQALGLAVGPPPIAVRRARVTAHDWTTRDKLPAALAPTLFAMPVGAVSPVLDDGESLVVVRLLERRFPHALPYEAVEESIRQEIVAQRRASRQRQYVDGLRRGSQIWSILDQGL